MFKIKNFKPTLIPTITTIFGLIILLSLSFWQFNRLHWKQDLIVKINNRVQQSEIMLPREVDVKQMEYRKISMKGYFLNHLEMHMYGGARQFKGEEGYYILTPFKIEDDPRIIIVNRGWVSKNLKNSQERPESIKNDLTEIHGAVMLFETKPRFVHDNQIEKNLWFYLSFLDIKKFTKLDIENFYILQSDTESKVLRGREVNVNLRNHHLGYALTWLFTAISLLVVYIKYHSQDN